MEYEPNHHMFMFMFMSRCSLYSCHLYVIIPIEQDQDEIQRLISQIDMLKVSSDPYGICEFLLSHAIVCIMSWYVVI